MQTPQSNVQYEPAQHAGAESETITGRWIVYSGKDCDEFIGTFEGGILAVNSMGRALFTCSSSEYSEEIMTEMHVRVPFTWRFHESGKFIFRAERPDISLETGFDAGEELNEVIGIIKGIMADGIEGAFEGNILEVIPDIKDGVRVLKEASEGTILFTEDMHSACSVN